MATILVLTWSGCGRIDGSGANPDYPIGKVIDLESPLGLPPIPSPKGNPLTAETIALGRRLFYERKLSSDSSLSCASCHNPAIGFADGRRRSIGVAGKIGVRNAPTLLNAAYSTFQFWDGRALSLEEQAGGPMSNSIEMNQPHEISVLKLQSDPTYQGDFDKAFGPGAVTIGRIEKALASFERTLISGDSPFDRYQYAGSKNAMGLAAVRGLAIFRDPAKGNCASCHTVGEKYSLFTDGEFHNIGAGVDAEGNLTDLGRYGETKMEREKGAFKTPTLRNIAHSAPYMHDGSLKTLREVVDYYAGGGNSNPYLDSKMKSIEISGSDRDDLVAFLQSLTGGLPPNVGPPENNYSKLSR